MRTKALIVAALVTTFMVAGLGQAIAGGGSLPPAKGKAVYNYLTQTEDYQKWPLFPGTTTFYEGQHPHGALLTTYVSADAQTAIQNRAGKIPNGGFIIKENYNPEKKLMAVTVMYRVEGYNPDAGDWFWAKYAADGSIQKEGKVAGCIGCHTAAIKNDWVFTGPLE